MCVRACLRLSVFPPPSGLRQDYATTSINRRSASFSFLSLHHSGEADLEEEEDEEEYGQLPPPQPRLTRVGPTLQRGLSHSHTFSSIRDWRRSTTSLSSPSTPQYPSGGFSYQPPPQPQALASPTLSTYTPEQQGFRPGSGEHAWPMQVLGLRSLEKMGDYYYIFFK